MASFTKMRFFGSNNQIYHQCLRSRLSADFRNRARLFQEALTVVFNETANYDFILRNKTWAASHRNKNYKLMGSRQELQTSENLARNQN